MTLDTVIENLNNTIDGKLKLHKELSSTNNAISNVVAKFLEINIGELKVILDDLNTLKEKNK